MSKPKNDNWKVLRDTTLYKLTWSGEIEKTLGAEVGGLTITRLHALGDVWGEVYSQDNLIGLYDLPRKVTDGDNVLYVFVLSRD
ncbi:MAG TPA: hypothetical protein VMQ44_02010 [Candidatus Saccharimonadales bacterium]|nr:hypothetical protein [Candidatus Saccharimonadales bacterium]